MISQTEENYLKALFKLRNEKGEINISELSAALQVSTPTANSMVKKLDAQGLLTYEKYKPLKITSKGKRIAASIIRKHRLTEMFLVQKMGFSWEEVHEIAEQVEHVRSVAFFDRMDAILGHPTKDPHGSPIPDKEGNVILNNYRRLTDCQEGDSVCIKALAHSDVSFLKYLNSHGLLLDTKLHILNKEPFDGSLTVRLTGDRTVVLSAVASDYLLVADC